MSPNEYEEVLQKLQQELDAARAESSMHKTNSSNFLNDLHATQKQLADLQQELEAARVEIESLSIKLQRTVNAAYCALLETTAWMGIPEKKRDNQINQAMENVKYCAEHDLRHQDISNIKNEYQKQLADAHALSKTLLDLNKSMCDENERAIDEVVELKAQIKDYESALKSAQGFVKSSDSVGHTKALVQATLNKWSGK